MVTKDSGEGWVRRERDVRLAEHKLGRVLGCRVWAWAVWVSAVRRVLVWVGVPGV